MGIVIKRKTAFQSQCLQKTTKLRRKNAGLTQVKAASANAVANDLLPELDITERPVAELKAGKRRVRKTEPEHLAGAVQSIKHFGFVSPITIRGDVVVDGFVRLEAAKELGMTHVRCIDVGHLSEAKARMLAISLNRLGETGTWDMPELKIELEELEIEGLDLTITGFTNPEIDIILTDDGEPDAASEANIPEPPLQPVSKLGDLWLLGHHRLLCGNSLEAEAYDVLMDGAIADAVLTDPPYNVKIAGNVSGLGKTKHGEFKMGSGELSASQFADFLRTAHKHCADHLGPGAVVYSFMDWRSIDVLMNAGSDAGLTLINMAVWYKGSGAMGGFLRSAHELVCVFCKGDKPKLNNVQLGKHGRDRTNVWVYPGANKPGTAAAEALKNHPTPKNLEMCCDAIRDVTAKGDVVLDPFLGSGTTVIAAEKTGRVCYGIELDAGYADVCLKRWEAHTGNSAVHAETGMTFREMEATRNAEAEG